MKRQILVWLMIIMTECIYAQFSPRTSLIDTALVKIGYVRITVLDTLNPLNIKTDYLILKAGKKASAFYSEERRLDDSLVHYVPGYLSSVYKDKERRAWRAGLEKEEVFKRRDIYQTWSHLRFDLTNWILYEELEKPDWKITDETDTVLGFPCIKATADFRGREWTALFTPDIPIPEGPWKLCGLPGLILKAYDSKGHYVYEAKDIDTKAPGLVQYTNFRDRLVLKNRIKALCLRREAKKKDIRQMMTAAFGIKVKPNPQLRKEEEARKNHDFEETDYPHN